MERRRSAGATVAARPVPVPRPPGLAGTPGPRRARTPTEETEEEPTYEKLALPGGDLWVWTVAPGDPDLDDLAAAASVVVADSDDTRTAPRLGRHAAGVLVELGADESRRVEAATQAIELAFDDARASRLVAATVLASRRGSADRAARALMRLFDLDREPLTMHARLETHLGHLRVPASSPFQLRLDAAFVPFDRPAPPLDPITDTTSRTNT